VLFHAHWGWTSYDQRAFQSLRISRYKFFLVNGKKRRSFFLSLKRSKKEAATSRGRGSQIFVFHLFFSLLFFFLSSKEFPEKRIRTEQRKKMEGPDIIHRIVVSSYWVLRWKEKERGREEEKKDGRSAISLVKMSKNLFFKLTHMCIRRTPWI